MVRVDCVTGVGCMVVATVLLGGCSIGPRNLTLGFNGGAPSLAPSGSGGSIAGRTRTTGKSLRARRSDAAKALRTARLDRRTTPQQPNQVDTRLIIAEARQMINGYRRKNGLKPLVLNLLLAKAAKAHSRDLAKWDRISHYGSDGSNPWDRVRRTGYKARLAAENVGTGQSSLAEVFKGWQQSPGHDKNLLLRGAVHMGIALVRDPKTEFKTFWTLVVGSPI